jgi:hypothetical protein
MGARKVAISGEDWDAMTEHLTPGQLVRNPDAPDWGLGQVQSVIGNRVTVNFENQGKQLVDVSQARLDVVAEDRE